jgi:hypothetical protein
MIHRKEINLKFRNQYGPWALVTGASSGIGLELAERLAESGLNIILHGRRSLELQKISTRIAHQYSVQTKVISSDLTSDEGVQAVISACENIDIGLLVASAGFGTSGYFHESNINNEIGMLRVNCEALLRLTHYFSQRFIKQQRGGIVLLSSIVAFQGVPLAAHYAATKAYVQSLGEALSRELKPFGINVLTAAPGPVASGFGERANMKMDISLKTHQVGNQILHALGKKSIVLPGMLTKILVGSLSLVPRWGKVLIMEKVMGGMTAHQRKPALAS